MSNKNIVIDKNYIYKFNSENKPWRIIRDPLNDNTERMNCLYQDPNIGQGFTDYIRYRTLGLCHEEIVRKRISGSVAELGVFMGTFAVKLNLLFNNKQLFLYDTFEGFDDRDIIYEQKITEKSWYNMIQDTSKNNDLVALVKSKMKYPNKVIFRKGYFPESAINEYNETFCFVSIDADIYLPTLKGLEFFYKRLEKGGYIFVHDGKFSGVQKAINEFSSINNIAIVPICDQTESYIITK